MTETKKELHILELRGQWNAAVRVFGNLMLKLKQRSCNKLKTILHGKVIFACNSCLDSQIQIPTLFGVFLFFFLLSTLFSISLINASIYSSFVLNYLPSRMLAVFALCHSLGGAFANFDATRGLGICQPRGPGHPWALHTIMEPKYS